MIWTRQLSKRNNTVLNLPKQMHFILLAGVSRKVVGDRIDCTEQNYELVSISTIIDNLIPDYSVPEIQLAI